MRFTSVIPCFNDGVRLRHALADLRPQFDEVIVVDDGSTDGTRSVLEPYGDRVSYFFQANRGVAAALNAGTRRATGEFVSILNADDFIARFTTDMMPFCSLGMAMLHSLAWSVLLLTLASLLFRRRDFL